MFSLNYVCETWYSILIRKVEANIFMGFLSSSFTGDFNSLSVPLTMSPTHTPTTTTWTTLSPIITHQFSSGRPLDDLYLSLLSCLSALSLFRLCLLLLLHWPQTLTLDTNAPPQHSAFAHTANILPVGLAQCNTVLTCFNIEGDGINKTRKRI